MRLLFALGLLFFLPSAVSIAQNLTRQQLFDVGIDYVNCKMMHQSFLEHDEQTYNEVFIERFGKCELEEGSSIDLKPMRDFLLDKTLTASVGLSNDLEKEKAKLDPFWDDNEVLTYFSETLLSGDSLESVNKFKTKREDTYQDFKDKMMEELVAFYKVTWDKAERPSIATANNSQSVEEGSKPEFVGPLSPDERSGRNNRKSREDVISGPFALIRNIIFYLLGAILLLVIGWFSYFFYRRYKELMAENKDLKYKINQYTSQYNSLINSVANNRQTENELENLKEENRNLKKELKALKQDSNSNFSSGPETVLVPEIDQNTDVGMSDITSGAEQDSIDGNQKYNEEWSVDKKPEVEPEVFYFSTPSKDGSFADNFRAKTYKPNAHLYEFKTIDKQKQNAEFKFIDDPSAVADAINYPDRNIDPVCEAVSAFKSNSTRIITATPGKARLDGGKWIVTEKAKIRYE